jgi:hypothetical protein
MIELTAIPGGIKSKFLIPCFYSMPEKLIAAG